jgi:cytochrome b561
MKLPAYTRTAAALHWGHAVLLVALVVIGLDMAGLPKGPERTAAFALHKSLGLVALAVIAVRLGWRLRCPPPPHPGLDGAERALAASMHRLLYLLLLLVPLTGFASVCFTQYPLKFFGLPLPKPGWPDAELNALFGLLHKASLIALGLAVGLHLAAVLRHAWRRDGTLGRMLPSSARLTGDSERL